MENHDGIDKRIQHGGDRQRNSTPTLLDLFGQVALSKSGEIAIEACGNRLTYRELDEWSNRVAHALIVWGIDRGQVVAIASTACAGAVASMLGTWKIGAVCFLFDPADKCGQFDSIMQRVGVSLVVAMGTSETALDTPLPQLILDDDDIAGYSNLSVSGCADLPEPAYFISEPHSTETPVQVIAAQGSAMPGYPVGVTGPRVLRNMTSAESITELIEALAQGVVLVMPSASE